VFIGRGLKKKGKIMSLEFMDGFDHYTQSNALRKWDTVGSTTIVSPGRFGGAAAQLWNGGFLALTQGQLSALATRTIGFAMYPSQYGSGIQIVGFLDSGSIQVDLRLDASGHLVATRNGTTLGTSTYTLTISIWVYVEIQATINSTTGSVVVKVWGGSNPGTWLNLTAQNTQATTNATSNGIRFYDFGKGSASAFLDDVYVLNSSGSVNNTFLGECRILTSLPTADSATNKAWTPDTGTVHFSRVNETSPDDDTSYVYSATAGQLDTYTFATVSPAGAVAGVQTTLCARKDDVGSRTISAEYRGGGANYTGANSFSPASGYLMYRQIYETDPATGLAWTAGGINAGEFGINCVA
jgi:hypothetical protein